ncbi:hypothetical protein [Nocardia abscessus]|nr:hypothetical protein [Nocardia abscessus]MCC3328334.1 hypothetical protein [Nocardia abscessus]
MNVGERSWWSEGQGRRAYYVGSADELDELVAGLEPIAAAVETAVD